VSTEWESPRAIEDITKIPKPEAKIFFRLHWSPSFPKGRRKIEEAKRKLVGIQLKTTASIGISRLITGKAMFTEETQKGVKNDPRTEMKTTTLF